MSGEGTGGGGAVALLLVLWIGAVGYVMGQSPFEEEAPVAGRPSGATEVDASPQPQLPECTEVVDCDEPITRIELAGVLVETFALPMATADYFTDDDGLAGEIAVNRLAAAGITSGCRDDLFCPKQVATRGHAASFLVRALGLDASTARDFFEDDEGTKHEAAINALAAAGIVDGCDGERFCPHDPVTRSMLIAFLERALELDEPVA